MPRQLICWASYESFHPKSFAVHDCKTYHLLWEGRSLSPIRLQACFEPFQQRGCWTLWVFPLASSQLPHRNGPHPISGDLLGFCKWQWSLLEEKFLWWSFSFMILFCYSCKKEISHHSSLHLQWCLSNVTPLHKGAFTTTQSCLTLCNPVVYNPPGSSVHGDSPGKNSGVGCHALLQQIFPIQGLNLGLSHCRWILHHLSHQGSPRILEWVA